MSLIHCLTSTFPLRDDHQERLRLWTDCFMLFFRFSSFVFRKRSDDVDLSHLRGQGPRRPHPHPVPERLPQQQRQRDGRHAGAAEGHPEVEGWQKRHLQVQKSPKESPQQVPVITHAEDETDAQQTQGSSCQKVQSNAASDCCCRSHIHHQRSILPLWPFMIKQDVLTLDFFLTLIFEGCGRPNTLLRPVKVHETDTGHRQTQEARLRPPPKPLGS